MKEYLGVDGIKIKEIILGGHSYGGGTALATKAMFN
jgi:predicted dienelactone hydrolase